MEKIKLESEVKIIEIPLFPARMLEVQGIDINGKKDIWNLKVTKKAGLVLI